MEKNKKGCVVKFFGVLVEDEEFFLEWDEWFRLEKEGFVIVEEEVVEEEVEEEDDEEESVDEE